MLEVMPSAEGWGDCDTPIAPPPREPARPTTVTAGPAMADLTVLGAALQLAAEERKNVGVMAGVNPGLAQ